MAKMAKYLFFFALIFVILTTPAFAQTGHWEQLNPPVSPLERSSFGMTSIGDNQVLLFGGDGVGYFNDTWLFDYKTKTWSELNPKVSPAKRTEFRMCQLSKNLVLLFGGEDQGLIFFNDTWIFNLSDTSWSKLELDTFPVARSHFGMETIAENKALLFGGQDYNIDLRNDTWIFDYVQRKWTKIIYKNNPPIPFYRLDPMISQIEDRKIILFGGYEFSHYLSDTWLFDLDSLKWEELNSIGMTDSLTSSGACSLIKDKMFIFGGESIQGLKDNTWLFDYVDNNWNIVGVNISPPARMYTGLVKIDVGVALLFGGYNFKGSMNDSWLFIADINNVQTNFSNSDSIFISYGEDNIKLSLISFRESNIEIELIDLMGNIKFSEKRQFWSGNVFEYKVPTDTLIPGIYFLRIKSGNKNYIRKIII